MEKGISFYFGFNSDCKDRAKRIKEIGFDTIMTNQDERFIDQNGDINFQMSIFKENNLNVSSLHNQYKTEELSHFWENDEIGEKLEKTLIFDILTAKDKNFKCVVVHMVGNYSKVGEERLIRILNICKDSNVFLAVENINYQKPFIDIFDNIDHLYLKFCYDSGHNNCFDPDFDYLEKYGDKLICLHLHDNNGIQDQHTLNKFGTIDWNKIAKKLAKLNLDNISLDYEILMYGGIKVSEDECLKETFKQAVELEYLVNKYKSKY